MRHLAFAFALVTLPAVALAQTGPCPTTPVDQLALSPARYCFNAASNHAQVEVVTGQPVIDHYDLAWFLDGVDVQTGAPLQRVTVGKPTPNSDGAIWGLLPAYPIGQRLRSSAISVSTLASVPAANREARSVASNPFGVPATVTVSASALIVVR